jgi:hypothetical protein
VDELSSIPGGGQFFCTAYYRFSSMHQARVEPCDAFCFSFHISLLLAFFTPGQAP